MVDRVVDSADIRSAIRREGLDSRDHDLVKPVSSICLNVVKHLEAIRRRVWLALS